MNESLHAARPIPHPGLHRRRLVAAATAAAALACAPARAAPSRHPTRAARPDGDYAAFLAALRQEAAAKGLGEAATDAIAQLSVPNAKVVQLDHHQPEFTLTWAQYRARVLPQNRLDLGAASYRDRVDIFRTVTERYGVDPGVIIGIWGLESSFGAKIGTFGVIDALATLAYDGRRAAFFRGELFDALKIIDQRDIGSRQMIGSYAGAMGQPQFMPSAYLRFASSYAGTDRADIWTNERDVFASIANYLGKSGWRAGEPWGQEVSVSGSIPAGLVGRGHTETLSHWQSLGVRRADGSGFSRPEVTGSLLQPDGAGGPSFMVYHNFQVIRRYNPSDFYALAVGLLGNAAT